MQRALQNCGIELSGSLFTDIDCADDLAMFDHDMQKLANVLENIERESAKLGLHISWSKTKIQNFGSGLPAAMISVLDRQVERVSHFTYLASLIDCTGGSRTDCLRLIGLASNCMHDLSNVWKQKQSSQSTKLRLYSSLVVLVLLYGSDKWTLNKHELSRLQAFHKHNQRVILNVYR